MLIDLSDAAYGKDAHPACTGECDPATGAFAHTPGCPDAPAGPTPLIQLLAEEVGDPGHVQMPTGASDLMDSPMEWSWEQLRDYVLRQIAERHGPQPGGGEAKTAAIFRSFAARHGNQAGPIAVFAFEQMDGYWRSAPITVSRFTKGSDPYFAFPIIERITHA